MSLLDDYINSELPTKQTLLKIFAETDPLIIFDIGACEGEDSIRYSRLFPNSKVYSFEPLPGNIVKIKSNIAKYKATNISLEEVALSDNEGTAEFFVSSGSPEIKDQDKDWDFGNKSSSLLKPDKVKDHYKWLKFENKIVVKTSTIEDFCEKNHIESIDFIHLDVQGAELLVLKGAAKILKEVKCIFMEVENVSLYENQPLKDDVQKFMSNNNFVKVLDSVEGLSGDQFYIKKELAAK